MSQSKVFMFDNSDPEMQEAQRRARAAFRYFWRELFCDYRRIIPGLDMAVVKAPFADAEKPADSDDPQVEHMWFNDIQFDGEFLTGTLLNQPNWIKSFSEGDEVSVALENISDWMYSLMGDLYGGFTVNLTRARMSPRERKEHDEAWGLEFGDPNKIRTHPAYDKPNETPGSGPKLIEPIHPFHANMAPKIEEQLKADPDLAKQKDEKGWTFLHFDAMSGNLPSAKLMVEYGAPINAVTNNDFTALQLAKNLGWTDVAEFLKSAGAK